MIATAAARFNKRRGTIFLDSSAPAREYVNTFGGRGGTSGGRCGEIVMKLHAWCYALPAAMVMQAALCGGQTSQPAAVTADPNIVAAVAAANNAFAVDLYHRIAGKDANAAMAENVFLSPASIHMCLAAVHSGARGKTAAQLGEVLHLPQAPEKTASDYAQLIEALRPRTPNRQSVPYELSAANGLWVGKGIVCKPAYMAGLKRGFAAEIKMADFTDGPGAAKSINDWVALKTHDRIKDIITPAAFTRDTAIVLANAIYFKAAWDQEFSTTQTEKFYVSPSENLSVVMMHETAVYRYKATKAVQVAELPYKGQQMSMVVILPMARYGLAALEKDLTSETLASWTAALQRTNIEVILPGFEFTSRFNLVKTLGAMGVTDAFIEGKANLSGALDDPRSHVGGVDHQAFVAVDESGTEAAAATVTSFFGVTNLAEKQPNRIFRADHPFLFLIRHNATGEILFMGKVVRPNEVKEKKDAALSQPANSR